MFALHDSDQAIQLEASHTSLGCLKLCLETAVSDNTKVHFRPGDEGYSIGSGGDRILKTTLVRNGKRHERKILVTDTEVHMERHGEPVNFPAGFMPSGGGSLAQDAEQLSEIKKLKRDHMVVDALK